MNEVQRVARQGFRLQGENDLDLAFLSLRTAIKAYFSTYDAVRNRFDSNDSELDKRTQDNVGYCEACAETIVHFQHFFELIIKYILRRDHLLLASRVYSYPTILHKILHNKPLSHEEEQKIQSLEFSDALKTLCALIKTKQIQSIDDLEFILDHKCTFEELNTLRNRVWHRGSFFLYYTKLDEFVGKFILPVIDVITQMTQFKDVSLLWKYKHTKCGIDPIQWICHEYQTTTGSVCSKKVALLKEIGRAAYSNPLHDMKILQQQKREKIAKIEQQIHELEKRGENIPKSLLMSKGLAGMGCTMANQYDAPYIEKAKKMAKNQAEDGFLTIKNCPVCGVDCLVLYDESDTFQDSQTGENVHYNVVHSAKCECCTFEIDSKLEIAEYQVPIENYWTFTRL